MAFSDDDWDEYKKIECDKTKVTPLYQGKSKRLVDEYVLKDDEVLSSDGNNILCRKCGGIKGTKKRGMALVGEGKWEYITRWTSEQCECERRRLNEHYDEEYRQNNVNIAWNICNNPVFTESVGKRYESVRFSDDFYNSVEREEDFKKIASRLKTFVENYDRASELGAGWYLWSPSRGNGKTSLASCVRNGLLDKGVSCIVIDARKLNDLKRRDVEAFNRCKTVSCLIIDDIGLTVLNDWECDTLHEVVNFRYLNVKDGRYVTCYTSNVPPEDLAKANVKVASIDRIAETSKTSMKLNGNSMRLS